MSQLDVFGGETATAKLGPRQQLILDELRRRGDMTADEAGAYIHWKRGRHDEGARCAYCAREGNQVLVSLRSHGLVIRRRASGRWELRSPRDTERSPVTYNEFPEGF